ncbi:uncharacterized protein LOC130666293 [Microplitis mediator]|uniref:uncharacterized protein LOC130666293 n=1 Tax=Microplitis mediator TaxID=375433 RepID=UPI0025524401|nr:uncharacterized protein LOC130666293 [Microplitis mediator]XP_057323113.1 uncharacterized protein LOC130666293 [Microplitis mediator]
MINGISYGYIIPNEWADHAIGLIWRIILPFLRNIIASGQQLDGETITVGGVSTILRVWNARLCWFFSKPGDQTPSPYHYRFSPNLLAEQFPEFQRIYGIELPPLSWMEALNDVVLLNLTYSVLMPQSWVTQNLTDEIADTIIAALQPGVDDPDGVIFTLGGITVQLGVFPEAMCWWYREVDNDGGVSYFQSANLHTQGPVANNGPLQIYWPDDDMSTDDGFEDGSSSSSSSSEDDD